MSSVGFETFYLWLHFNFSNALCLKDLLFLLFSWWHSYSFYDYSNFYLIFKLFVYFHCKIYIFFFLNFRFDPDRFSTEALKLSSSSPVAFQPFAFADKRTHLANERIQLYASIYLVQVLRQFRLSLVKGQVVTPVYGLVTHPDDEIWITATKLEKSWVLNYHHYFLFLFFNFLKFSLYLRKNLITVMKFNFFFLSIIKT